MRGEGEFAGFGEPVGEAHVFGNRGSSGRQVEKVVVRRLKAGKVEHVVFVIDAGSGPGKTVVDFVPVPVFLFILLDVFGRRRAPATGIDRAVGPCGKRAFGARRIGQGGQRLVDFEQQIVGGLLVGQFLPVDHPEDEIDGVVVAGKRQQDAAIHDRDAALVDEFGLEADRCLVGDDLQMVIGDARQQRASGNVGQLGDRARSAAFDCELVAEKHDRRILDAAGEIEQHAVGAEIGQVGRDRGPR